MKNEDKAKKHFISLLSYLRDNKNFTEMMKVDRAEVDRALEYVEDKGLRVYGLAVRADKKKMLEMLEDENVYGIGSRE